jgi:hypothetical protein
MAKRRAATLFLAWCLLLSAGATHGRTLKLCSHVRHPSRPCSFYLYTTTLFWRARVRHTLVAAAATAVWWNLSHAPLTRHTAAVAAASTLLVIVTWRLHLCVTSASLSGGLWRTAARAYWIRAWKAKCVTANHLLIANWWVSHTGKTAVVTVSRKQQYFACVNTSLQKFWTLWTTHNHWAL